MLYRIDFFYKVTNILYYIGIVAFVCLYSVDDNTILWLIAEGMIVLGLLGAVIPDMMINIGIDGISVNLVRKIILIKYLVFCIIHSCLDKYFIITIIIILISFLGDMFLERQLFKEFDKECVSVDTFVEKMNSFDTSRVDGVKKYFVIYVFDILLYLNIHETNYEFFSMLIISLVIHGIVSERIIKQMKYGSINRIRVVMWSVFGITILCASLNYKMITYSLVGTYVMIVMDILQEKNTSLIRGAIFNKSDCDNRKR